MKGVHVKIEPVKWIKIAGEVHPLSKAELESFKAFGIIKEKEGSEDDEMEFINIQSNNI